MVAPLPVNCTVVPVGVKVPVTTSGVPVPDNMIVLAPLEAKLRVVEPPPALLIVVTPEDVIEPVPPCTLIVGVPVVDEKVKFLNVQPIALEASPKVFVAATF